MINIGFIQILACSHMRQEVGTFKYTTLANCWRNTNKTLTSVTPDIKVFSFSDFSEKCVPYSSHLSRVVVEKKVLNWSC